MRVANRGGNIVLTVPAVSPVFLIMNFGNMSPADAIRYFHAPRPPVHRHFSTPRPAPVPRTVVNLSETSEEDNLNLNFDMEFATPPNSGLQWPPPGQVFLRSPPSAVPPSAVPTRPPPARQPARVPKKGTQCKYSTFTL
jgi:hypothetical protein